MAPTPVSRHLRAMLTGVYKLFLSCVAQFSEAAVEAGTVSAASAILLMGEARVSLQCCDRLCACRQIWASAGLA